MQGMRLSPYRELRLQPWWMLAVAISLSASLGIAWGAATFDWLGILIALGASAGTAWWWWSARSPIEVTAEGIRVGKMFLEYAHIGGVEALDPEAFLLRTSSGSRADDVNSLLHRSFGGVVIEVNDPTDPFEHWVIGSRNAAGLAKALSQAQGS